MADCSQDIFIVPCTREHYLLHAPRHRLSALVNGAAAREIRQALQFGYSGAMSPGSECLVKTLQNTPPSTVTLISGGYQPEHLNLFTTNDCNMRCRYCLASAGDYTPTYMSKDFCRIALDFYVETLRESGRKSIKVTYLGGEPLLAEDLLVFANSYARKLARQNGFSFDSELTTNGLMTERQALWMAQNLSHVIVSMDGPPAYHDPYRRDHLGEGTHARIERTIRILENEGTAFALRCSVDEARVAALPEMVEFMIKRYRPSEIAIEPVLEYGRCSQYGIRSPDPDTFVRSTIEAAKIVRKAGVQMVLRLAQPNMLSTSHCSLTRDPCVVTCDGFISACCRMETSNTPGAANYIIGKIDLFAGRVVINDDRLQEMRQRGVNQIPGCAFCFAKWHCGGGCRLYQKQACSNHSKGYLCHITRDLTRWAILDNLGVSAIGGNEPTATVSKSL